MTAGLLINYLGFGLDADRDPAGPDVHPSAIALYYSTDTSELWFWADAVWNGPIPLTAVPTSIADLLAVDGVDGQIIRRVGGIWVADNESVEEAASDGNKYGRKNGAWAIINEGIADAPSDGVRYVRKDNAWVSLAAYLATLGYLGDAPSDGTRYGRLNGAWSAIPAAGISDAPSDGVRYVRKDAAWVSLTSYLTSLGYLTDAPSDGTEYVRKNGAWVHAVGGGGGGVWYLNPPLAASMTNLVSGDATLPTVADHAGAGLVCDFGPSRTGDVTRAALMPIPNPNASWSIFCHYRWNVMKSNYMYGGFMLRDNAHGRFVTLGPIEDGGGDFTVRHFNTLVGGGANVGGIAVRDYWQFARVDYNVGAETLTYYCSNDGASWLLLATISRTFYYVNRLDRVGFGVTMNNGAAINAKISCDALTIT
jgi:hypothetical protein